MNEKIIRFSAFAVSLLLALQLIGCSIFGTAPEETVAPKVVATSLVSEDGIFYDVYDNGEITVTGRRDGTATLAIPDEIEGKPVTAIGAEAFLNDGYLVHIELGKNVRQIDEKAFCGCTELVRVDATEGLKVIGYFAFFGCSILSSVNGATGLEKILDSAFCACPALCYIDFPDTLTEIGAAAFYNCRSLCEADLPDGVKTLEGQTFSGCTSLYSVELGGVSAIMDEAFLDCTSLLGVDLGNITSLGSRVFYGCKSLAYVTEVSGLVSVGPSAFGGTHWLDSQKDEFVTVGDGVLIKYNGSSKDVEVPKKVKYISDAFAGNESIVNVKISGKTKTVGENAFLACRSIESVTVDAEVEAIGVGAFGSCSSLRTVYLPKSLVKIDDSAFSGCIIISTVKYAGSSEDFAAIEISSGNNHMLNADFTYNAKP